MLPAVTLAVIPMGIVTRTVRGLVSDIMSQDYITTLRGKGLRRPASSATWCKNAAPNACSRSWACNSPT